jgi:pyridoxamine 5'-phosphate oxidase
MTDDKKKGEMMDIQEYVKFANDTRTCYLATVEGDQPRVRAMGMCFADETGFYFNTESVKALSKQLAKNQKVEIIFHHTKPGPDAGKVMRLSGKVEFVNDPAIRARIYKDRQFLKGVGITTPEDPRLVVFRISKGEAFFWTMAENMKEASIPRIKFGE